MKKDKADLNARNCFGLLKRMCDGLIRYQIKGQEDGFSDGGIYCPACALFHGRISDAVLPFLTVYFETGEEKYLQSARDVITWSEKNVLLVNGAYANDKTKEWSCTTVFSNIAVGTSLLWYKERLPEDFRDELGRIFRRQNAFLVDYFESGHGANINYFAAFAYAEGIAFRLFGKEKDRRLCEKYFDKVMGCFTPDGLLFGEGRPPMVTTPKGFRGVDIGYNMEESLPSLCACAGILGREKDLEKLEGYALSHLEFLLPDGGMDNSFGSRAFKWTYYGSRTSDGAFELYVDMAKRNPVFRKAAARQFELLCRCSSDEGLLYGGLYYEEAGEKPCVHHSFCRAKSLCFLYKGLKEAEKAGEAPLCDLGSLLPREEEYGRRSFPSIGIELCSVGDYRCTFSENDLIYAKGTNTGNGTLTLLWHGKRGAVLAANMAHYNQVEPLNMQRQMGEVQEKCIAPRIEKDGFSSMNDTQSRVECDYSEGVFTYRVNGTLTDADGKRAEDGAFSLQFTVTKDGVAIFAKAPEGAGLYLPVCTHPEDGSSLSGKTAAFRDKTGEVRVTADTDIRLVPSERGEKTFSTVGGFLCAVLRIGLSPEGTCAGIAVL